MTRSVFILFAMLLVCGTFGASPADAQIWKDIKDTAKRAAEREVVREVHETTTEVVRCAFDDQRCIDQAERDGKTVETVDANGEPVSSAGMRPGEGAWANYDFVPGERVLFAEDFGADRVGNFPQRLEFKSGNMQIVEWQGRRWLSAEDGEFYFGLPETLPERFTMQFDLAGSGNAMQINFATDVANVKPYVEVRTDFARFLGADVNARGDLQANTEEQPVRIRIAVDGDYLKLYANEHRVLNIPNAKMSRANGIYIFMNGWSAEKPRMIANLRVAAGGREMYDALMADGRVATQGVFFDTGRDALRPESTPTLNEIGEILRQHPDLRLTIEGHTDNVGDDASNQALSEKRAAAVKAYLIDQHAIDAARLESAGFGASRPAASNDTPEGRQQNRRVELVKL